MNDSTSEATGRHMHMRLAIECPRCATRCMACDSRALSTTEREITYRCRDSQCGFTRLVAVGVKRV